MDLQKILLTITIYFIVGVICGIRADMRAMYAAIFAVLSITAVLAYYKRTYLIGIVAGVVFLLSGCWLGYLDGPRHLEQFAQQFQNQSLTIQGYVEPGSKKETEYYHRFTLKLTKNISAIPNENVDNRRINVYVRKSNYQANWQDGELLKVTGTFARPHNYNNPGGFDVAEYYYIHDLVGNVRAEGHVEKLGFYDGWLPSKYFKALVEDYRQKLQRILPVSQAAVVQGLIIGNNTDIPEQIWEDFALTGLIHILSISGMHTTLLAGFVFYSLRSLVGKRRAAFISLWFLLAYVLLAGAVLPVVRAGIMSALLLGGVFVKRAPHLPAIFNFTVLLMLGYNPSSVLDVSFQLTCLATGALIYLAPILHEYIHPKLQNDFLSGMISATLAVQILIFPVLVNKFYYFSWISFIGNILLVPVLEMVIVALLIGSVSLWILLPVGQIIIVGTSFVLDFAVHVNAVLANAPSAISVVGSQSIYVWVLYYTIVVLIFFIEPIFRDYKKILSAFLLVIVLFTTGVIPLPYKQHTQMHFIDVGQGDACLITTSAGSTVLIDTGGSDGSWDIGRRVLLPYLRYLGVSKIDLLVFSHGHADHSKAALSLVERMPIKNIVLHPNMDTPHLEYLKRSVKNTKFTEAREGTTIQLDDCFFEVVAVPTMSFNANESLVLKLKSGAHTALFMGDAEQVQELYLLNKFDRIDILKVAHHGSKTSTSQEFLYKTKPRLGVISVGASNKFGHPSREVLNRLSASGTKVLRTDINGRVLLELRTDGIGIDTYLSNNN